MSWKRIHRRRWNFSAKQFFRQMRRPHKRTHSLIIYLKDQCLSIINFLHRVSIRDHRHAFCVLPMLLPQHVRNPARYTVRIGCVFKIYLVASVTATYWYALVWMKIGSALITCTFIMDTVLYFDNALGSEPRIFLFLAYLASLECHSELRTLDIDTFCVSCIGSALRTFVSYSIDCIDSFVTWQRGMADLLDYYRSQNHIVLQNHSPCRNLQLSYVSFLTCMLLL